MNDEAKKWRIAWDKLNDHFDRYAQDKRDEIFILVTENNQLRAEVERLRKALENS
jgi:regulator of replication initiation timing